MSSLLFGPPCRIESLFHRLNILPRTHTVVQQLSSCPESTRTKCTS